MSSKLLTADGKDALLDLNRLVRNPLKVKEKNLFVKLFFPKRMTVSFYNSIQVPEGKQIDDHTIFHEFQHYLDRCNLKDGQYQTSFIKSTWWYAKYFLPHILAIFALPALLAIPFSIFFLSFLIFLIFVLPITRLATFRRDMEIRGYFWTDMFIRNVDYSRIFGGLSYYYMDEVKNNIFYQKTFSFMIGWNVYREDDNMSQIYKVYTAHMIRKDTR